ncbi:MAG: hypothetical protein LQ342_003030 [Letrouitia transgressa]|nr:MAG: hypothetical protein LQ342_003030 [Letrouitia transgressa]
MDEDDVPVLVDTNSKSADAEGADAVTAEVADMNLAKVPLTLVTGENTYRAVFEPGVDMLVQAIWELARQLCQVPGRSLLMLPCSPTFPRRDTGVAAIESLVTRRGGFDYIMLETSGLADPGNLVPLFWLDDELGSNIYLDGVVTLVDTKNILRSLDEPSTTEENPEEAHRGLHLSTAHLQISHADVVILNKSDAVSAEQLQVVEERVRGINGLAKIHVTQYGRIPKLDGVLLDLHAYDGLESLDVVSKGHSHLDPNISTVTLGPLPKLSPSQLETLQMWLQSLLWESRLELPDPSDGLYADFSVYRTKGRVFTIEGAGKMIQGVREVFEITNEQTGQSPTGEALHQQSKQQGKLVFIGRGLADLPLQESLSYFLRL